MHPEASFLSFQRRHHRLVFIVLTLITILFLLLQFIIQQIYIQREKNQLISLLQALVLREQSNFANEIFENRILALQLRSNELLEISSVKKVSIYNGKGELILHSGLLSEVQPISSILDQLRTQQVAHVQLLPIGYLSYTQPIWGGGECLGFINIHYDMGEIKKNAQTMTIFIITEGLCIFLSLVFFFSRFFQKKFFQPLHLIHQSIARVREGNLKERIPLIDEDEFGELSRALNGMITALQYQDEQIRFTMQRISSLITTMPIMLVAGDHRGNILEWNGEAERITGYSLQDFQNKIITPSQIFASWKEWKRFCQLVIINGGQDFYGEEFVIRTKNCEQKIVALYNNSHQHQITGWAFWLLGLDITTQKQEEKRRQALEEELHQAHKMEALGQLAGGVAHDFNNQLASILGFAEILNERIQSEREREYIQQIIKSVEHSASLTRQLLAFARKGKYQVIPVNLCDIVNEVCLILERTVDRRIKVEKIFTCYPAYTRGDPHQIENAILNLALNARDAMPGGGKITFIVEYSQKIFSSSSEPDLDLPSKQEWVAIHVTDTGTGIPEEIRDRIFEPFFTTKERGKGTGMGLPAVYGIMQSHEGHIEVQSTVGKGSTFSLYFPYWMPSESDFTLIQPQTPILDNQDLNGYRILLVDDEYLVRRALRDLLMGTGATVEEAAGGKEAIEKVQNTSIPYHLVILDMLMPEVNGVEVFQTIRAQYPHLPILLVSGYTLEQNTRNLIHQDYTRFLQKPFNYEFLINNILELLKLQK